MNTAAQQLAALFPPDGLRKGALTSLADIARFRERRVVFCQFNAPEIVRLIVRRGYEQAINRGHGSNARRRLGLNRAIDAAIVEGDRIEAELTAAGIRPVWDASEVAEIVKDAEHGVREAMDFKDRDVAIVNATKRGLADHLINLGNSLNHMRIIEVAAMDAKFAAPGDLYDERTHDDAGEPLCEFPSTSKK